MPTIETPSPTVTLENHSVLPNFADTATAFAYKKDSELKKAYLLFKGIQLPLAVKLGPPLVNVALDLGLPIKGLLKTYFYDQFCGGYTRELAIEKAEKLYQYKVGSILDYSVEAQTNEKSYNNTAEEIIKAIAVASEHPAIPFVAMKMTGIAGIEVLSAAQSNKLTGQDKVNYEQACQRLENICAAAFKYNQPILIDAEESWIQDVIDTLAESMMAKYNLSRPIIYTTVQMYRTGRVDYLKKLNERMKSANAIAAVKLVRGAYLEKENDRAKKYRYPTPMQPSKRHTDADFDAAALYMLRHIDNFALLAGTHNEASCLMIANYLIEHNLSPTHSNVYFSQLLGMSDHISFNLAAAGFNVAKYLPYGPLESVMPYLFRRAQENSSIAGQTGRELRLIETEMGRRRLWCMDKKRVL